MLRTLVAFMLRFKLFPKTMSIKSKKSTIVTMALDRRRNIKYASDYVDDMLRQFKHEVVVEAYKIGPMMGLLAKILKARLAYVLTSPEIPVSSQFERLLDCDSMLDIVYRTKQEYTSFVHVVDDQLHLYVVDAVRQGKLVGLAKAFEFMNERQELYKATSITVVIVVAPHNDAA